MRQKIWNRVKELIIGKYIPMVFAPYVPTIPITPAYDKIRSYVWSCITDKQLEMCREMIMLFKAIYGDNTYYTNLFVHHMDAKVRVGKLNSVVNEINSADFNQLFK